MKTEVPDVAGMLDASYYKGCGERNGVERDVVVSTVCLEGNGTRESHRGDGWRESDQMYTLNTTEQHAVAYATQACGDRNNAAQSVSEELAYTIPANPMSDRGQAIVYGISPYASNAMLSNNPHSGIYEAETSRTLDLNGGSPACNQGGIAIVEPCLNSWDVQSKHIQPEDGVAESLYAGECRYGGGESYVLQEPTVYNGEVITSPTNQSKPNPGVCHALTNDSRNYLVPPLACDVYNQEVTGEVAGTVTAACGGTNTSGPKVISAGFKQGNGSKARGIGYEEEMSPSLTSADSGTNQTPVVLVSEDGSKSEDI